MDNDVATIYGNGTTFENSDISTVAPPQYNSLFPQGYDYKPPIYDVDEDQLPTYPGWSKIRKIGMGTWNMLMGKLDILNRIWNMLNGNLKYVFS